VLAGGYVTSSRVTVLRIVRQTILKQQGTTEMYYLH
jgi:hypothetical protein